MESIRTRNPSSHYAMQKEHKWKTYLGIYLGNLPTQNYVSYERKNKQLDICTMNNPAIFVFELKKDHLWM